MANERSSERWLTNAHRNERQHDACSQAGAIHTHHGIPLIVQESE